MGNDIDNGTNSTKEADNDQSDLLVEISNFRKQVIPKNPKKKQQKKDNLKNLFNIFEGREKVIDASDSKVFPIKIIKSTDFSDNVSDHCNLKIIKIIKGTGF